MRRSGGDVECGEIGEERVVSGEGGGGEEEEEGGEDAGQVVEYQLKMVEVEEEGLVHRISSSAEQWEIWDTHITHLTHTRTNACTHKRTHAQTHTCTNTRTATHCWFLQRWVFSRLHSSSLLPTQSRKTPKVAEPAKQHEQ